MTANISTLSLFPEIFSCLNFGVTGRAIDKELLTVKHWQLRNFSSNTHNTIDDRPFGGGPGMVIQAEPVIKAIETISQETSKSHIIYASPQGKPLSSKIVQSWQEHEHIIFLAGRYEGVDERAIEHCVDEEISIGDYVLSGGELAIAVMIDAYARLIPGALGNENSAVEDSFSKVLLDHEHYTRPEVFDGKSVPKILLTGNHQEIALWRRKQALGRTYLRRPDLLDREKLSILDASLLDDYLTEFGARETASHDKSN